MADGKAVLAYVVSDSVAYSWHRSMMGLVAFDSTNAGRLREGGGYLAIRGFDPDRPASLSKITETL